MECNDGMEIMGVDEIQKGMILKTLMPDGTLATRGIIVNVEFGDNGTFILCKLFRGGYRKYKFEIGQHFQFPTVK